jgi:hypothetical protein
MSLDEMCKVYKLPDWVDWFFLRSLEWVLGFEGVMRCIERRDGFGFHRSWTIWERHFIWIIRIIIN